MHSFTLGSRQVAIPSTWGGGGGCNVHFTGNCHVLFELTEKLALEVGFPSPFQTKTC